MRAWIGGRGALTPKRLELETDHNQLSVWIQNEQSPGWSIIVGQDLLENGFPVGLYEGVSGGRGSTPEDRWGQNGEPRQMQIERVEQGVSIRIHHPITPAGSEITVDGTELEKALQALKKALHSPTGNWPNLPKSDVPKSRKPVPKGFTKRRKRRRRH